MKLSLLLLSATLASAAFAGPISGGFDITGYIFATDANGRGWSLPGANEEDFSDLRLATSMSFSAWGNGALYPYGDLAADPNIESEQNLTNHPTEIDFSTGPDYNYFEIHHSDAGNGKLVFFHILTFNVDLGEDYVRVYGNGYATINGKKATRGQWEIRSGSPMDPSFGGLDGVAQVTVDGEAVPDTASTMTLLLIGIAGIGITRRRCKA